MPSALLLLGPNINGGFTPACGLVSLSGLSSDDQNFFQLRGDRRIFNDFSSFYLFDIFVLLGLIIFIV